VSINKKIKQKILNSGSFHITKGLFLLFAFFVGSALLHANKTDSLKYQLNQADDEEKIYVLIQLSKIYRTKSLDTAEIYAKQALQLALIDDDNRTLSQSYLELGNIYYLRGDTKEAIEFCDKGIAIIDNEDEELLNKLISNKGAALTNSGELDEGLKCFYQVLEYWEKCNDSVKIANLLNNIGVINIYRGDYDEAMKFLLESVEIYEKKGRIEDAAAIFGNIAQIYNEMDNFEKAIEYNTKALRVYDQLEDYYSQTGLLINLGNIYKNIDSLEKSIQCCQQALEIAKENGYTTLESLAYTNLGLAYEKQGFFDKASDVIKKSLDIVQQQEDTESEAKNLRFLGRLSKKQKKYTLALQHLNQSEQLAEQINLVSDYYEIYFEKYEVYAALNNHKKSLEYFRKYVEVKDSIFTEEKHRQITEIQTKYETEKKEKEVIMLSEENSMQRMIILKSRYYSFGLVVLIVIVLLFGTLFFRQNRIKSRQNTLELEQKLFRSQMNPHFIFNSLSAIQYFITKNKPLEASAYLSDFAKLMRLVIENSKEEYISLEQEIETMKYYVQMQKLRFDDNFIHQFELDKNIETEEVLIPPMLTQPFIENALEHAFKGRQEGNNLFIRYSLENKNLLVEVEDNGIGRKKASESKKSKHKSFAINLTQRRLEKLNRRSKNKIYFEIVDLESEEGKALGTKVKFHIPLMYEQ
jgi:tetratricopeptide (TPR) repeat protein